MLSLKKILGILTRYSFNKDYVIKCIDQRIVVELLGEKLVRVCREKGLLINNYFEVEIPAFSKPCVIPRIQYIEDFHRYLHEVHGAFILNKIIDCKIPITTYIFISTHTDDFLFMTYLYNRLKEENIELEINQLVEYGFKLFQLKQLYTRIKDLEKILRREYNEKLYYEYQDLVRELDRLTPQVKDLWEYNRELFDKIYSVILSIDKDWNDLIDSIRLNIVVYKDDMEELISTWKKIYMDIANIYQVSPIIIDTLNELEATSTYLNDIFKRVIEYLRSKGCNEILIVDGEEYHILERIVNNNVTIIQV